MQPVGHADGKCPQCGLPRVKTRRFVISMGLVALMALAFVILIMLRVIRNADIEAALPDAADENAPPSTPRDSDKPAPLDR
jgi:hypothetical protein